jgi:hypothetical protein
MTTLNIHSFLSKKEYLMQSFRIKNTKAFLDSGKIEIKPITILVGKNSCGKSSLLRFPAVLAQTANYVGSNPPISFFGENVDYGNFEDVVCGKKGNEISFSLSYKVDITGNTRISTDITGSRIMIGNRIGSNKNCKHVIKEATIDIIIQRIGKSIMVTQVDVTVANSPVSSLRWDAEKKRFLLTLLSVYENCEFVKVNESIEFSKTDIRFEKFFPVYECDILNAIITTNNFQISEERKSVIHQYFFMHHKLKDLSFDIDITDEELKIARIYSLFDFSAEIMLSIFSSFHIESTTGISYIGPFRQHPDRIYRNSEAIKIHVGSKGENTGDILARAYLAEDKLLYEKISKLIKNYFDYDLNIHDLGNNYFQLMLKDKNGIESNLIDVGFGISQVLPIISEVCISSLKKNTSNKNKLLELGINSIILVEQPELHLHPAAQARLADLFEMCISANENSRFIIETHSEHLISKLQVLIADENSPLTSDMVQILYIDKNENGEAFVQKMDIKDNGKFIKEWPSGFFDQGYTLARQLAKASVQKGK